MDNYLENIFSGIDNSIKLDENQKNVVTDSSNHIMVIAGAGSGKTTTICAKVKYLVDIEKINEQDILIISFTNKAVEEIKERINTGFKINANVCTFHKFAYEIIKKHDKSYKVLEDNYDIIKNIIINNKCTNNIIKLLLKDKKYYKKSIKYSSNLKYFIDYTVDNLNLYRIVGKSNINIVNNKKVIDYFNYLDNISNSYDNYLENNKKVDFEKMILKATNLIKNINYKVIIVDEYQDISSSRFNLIKEIINNKNIKTMVVGDDWQSIYSFAGSNSNMFEKYKKLTNANTHKIVNTYRNSNQLIEIAGNFVMKDNNLIKKSLLSIKNIKYPLEIYYYKNNIAIIIEKIIDKIIKENKVNSNILILGRYQMDIKYLYSDNIKTINNKIIYKKYPKISIVFLTVHSSKGLGYDNVIIINMLKDIYGFPSNIEIDQIKETFINKENRLLEERRLFYVALTRTKNKVYIVTKKSKKSIFIDEIESHKNILIHKKM